MGKGPGRWDLRNPEASGETDEAAAADEIPEVFREVFLLEQALAELGQGTVLDLADPLPGDVELFAHFLKGALFAVAQSEAELEDLEFARIQEVEASGDGIAKVVLGVFLHGVDGFGIGQQIHEGAVFAVLPDGDIEGDGAGGNFAEFGDASGFDLKLVGQFGVSGLAAELVAKGGADPAQALDLVDEMDGKADGFALVGEGPADGLFDPPASVGAELHPAAGLEAVDGLHQAEVALGDQVEDGQAAVVVIGGDFHHEAEIGFNHQLPGAAIAPADAPGELHFLGAVEEGSLADALEVGLKGGGEIFLPNDRCLLSGDFHVCFHRGLERHDWITFGLFLWRAKFVKSTNLKNLHKSLVVNEIKLIKNGWFRPYKKSIGKLRTQKIGPRIDQKPSDVLMAKHGIHGIW